MDVEAFFAEMPFAALLGIEMIEAGEGWARGRLGLREELSWSHERTTAHGGVTATLADTVGAAAVVSLVQAPVQTIDLRVDYLEPASEELVAEAEVVRRGSAVGVVDVAINDGETSVARARGAFRLP